MIRSGRAAQPGDHGEVGGALGSRTGTARPGRRSWRDAAAAGPRAAPVLAGAVDSVCSRLFNLSNT
ncbi:hypothetical protein HBB16_18145 [Pseudonocardia sp. MCCB 268]|nr:hypothetical protein [Pseudonocardia cytotoxica]